MGKKKVLAYGFGQQGKMLSDALAAVDTVTRFVAPEELDTPIGALLSSEGPEAGGAAEAPAVLVFSNVDRKELDVLLRAVRESGVTGGCLKAMETPTNRSWPLRKLAGELQEEHRLMTALMELKRLRDSITPNFLDPALMAALAQADELLKGQTEPTVQMIMEARMALEKVRKI